jgi:tetratricopeptide (TPR) repeat protein
VTELGPAGASSLDPIEHHLISGGELLRQNRLSDAQHELLAALDLAADNTKALALLGLAYFRAGKFAEALPVYRRLVGIVPSDASHQLNLGLVMLKLGDAVGAASALEKSRDIDPSQGRAVSYLGLAYARGGRFASAYQAFLLAGQHDLAREISDNLSADERAAIDRQIARGGAAETIAAENNSESGAFVIGGLTPSAASSSAPQPSSPPLEVAAEPAPVTVDTTGHSASIAVDDDAEPELEVRTEADASLSAQAAALASADRTAADDDSAFDALSALDVAAPPEAPAQVAPALPPLRLAPRRSSPPATRATAGVEPPDVDDFDAIVAEVERGAISRAVAQVAPSAVHGGGSRVAVGHRPPQPLSEFATTRLVRLEDGDERFEISANGVLIVRVTDKIFSRTEGVDITGGQLGYEPAHRRSRGQNRTEPFATGGRPMFAVTGHGHLIASARGGQFTAVTLDDDIFYLREDLVFAFEPALRWENGHVPGSRERIPMVQFRGSGAVAFRTERPLLAVKLAQERVLYVDATALAGWIGRVVPRAVAPADDGPGSELFVECSGEGVVLVEEAPAPTRDAT